MLGGWFCLGRALWSRIFPGGVCLPDVIALLVWYHPPGTELPSRFGGDGWIFKGFARIGRVVLSREGENVSLVVVVGMCAWKLWVRGAVLSVVSRVGAGSVKALGDSVTCFVGVLRGGGFCLLPKDLEKTRVFSKSYARLAWSA